jgi:biotin carboxyl carrier protein
VVEGATVAAGDPIVDITDFDPQYFERLKAQLTATQQALDASKVALETSERNLDRQKKLADRGLKSQRDYELAKLEYNKFLADVAAKEKDLVDIQSKLSRQSMQQVVAPRAGQIMRIYFPQGGAVVKEGDIMVTLAPETDELVVELLIDGNDLPLLSIGRQVRLQFEGWPAIQFSGWPSVAVGTFGGLIKTIDPSDSGGGKFRILVEPDRSDNPWPGRPILRQGVRTKGWVLLDTVPLWFELWRRFNGFPPTLGTIKSKFAKDNKSVEKIGKSLKKLGK